MSKTPASSSSRRRVDTCAFLPCDQADICCLPGGCVERRFGKPVGPAATPEPGRDDAPALNGTKPGRTNRDPAKIQRKRKPLNVAGGNPLRHKRR